jgi:hypothetical protein
LGYIDGSGMRGKGRGELVRRSTRLLDQMGELRWRQPPRCASTKRNVDSSTEAKDGELTWQAWRASKAILFLQVFTICGPKTQKAQSGILCLRTEKLGDNERSNRMLVSWRAGLDHAAKHCTLDGIVSSLLVHFSKLGNQVKSDNSAS